MKKSWDEGTGTFTWTFSGEVKPLTFVVPELPNAEDAGWDEHPCVAPAMVYGFGVKIDRAAALPVNPTTHKSEPDSVKRVAMLKMIEQLNSGVWNAERTGAKAKTVNVDALVAAMISVRQKNPIGVRQYVESCTEEKRTALSNSKEFAAAYVTALANQRPVLELSDEIDAEIEAIAD